MKKILICLLLLIIAIFVGGRLYYYLTDDFRIGNISSNYAPRSEWEIPPLTLPEKSVLATILQQKFTYIGKGVQSYAFGSEDGQYVIKFFKFKHLKPSPVIAWLPAWAPFESFRNKKKEHLKRKLDAVFEGYHLAYMQHRPESGLVFLHINPTKDLFQTLTVSDKMGRNHYIELDKVPFLIQLKAKTMRVVLHELLEQGNIEKAKVRISEIFRLYLSEYHKGMYDHDHGIMHNAGFVGFAPIHLDVGKLRKEESMRLPVNYSHDIGLVARRMAKWLKANESSNYSELSKHIEEEIGNITQQPFFLQ